MSRKFRTSSGSSPRSGLSGEPVTYIGDTPTYYLSDGMECLDAMYALDHRLAVDFCLGNVLKYIERAGRKGDQRERDVEKATDYYHRMKGFLRDMGGDES